VELFRDRDCDCDSAVGTQSVSFTSSTPDRFLVAPSVDVFDEGAEVLEIGIEDADAAEDPDVREVSVATVGNDEVVFVNGEFPGERRGGGGGGGGPKCLRSFRLNHPRF